MCFTCPGGSGGVPPLTTLWRRVGPLPKHLRAQASEASRLAEARVYVSWRLWEAHLYVFDGSGKLQGGPASNEAMALGGSPS